MRGQPQIIVRGQVYDLLAVEGADGRLFVLEHAQTEVRAFGLEVVKLLGEIRKRIGACSGGCHFVLPDGLRIDGSGQISEAISLILAARARKPASPAEPCSARTGQGARPYIETHSPVVHP